MRNIIWYNQPYNKGVSINIGCVFLNLLDKHFQKEHKLNKIFNRNSVKVSHSCPRNIEHIIKNHSRKITESYIEKSAEASCNCKEKKSPLEGNCLIKNIVYMAKIETETNTSGYVGMTGHSCKTRCYNHIKSLKINASKTKPNCQSIYGDLKKMKSSTPSPGKICVNLTPANDGPGCVTCASRRRWRYYLAKQKRQRSLAVDLKC